MPKKAPPRTCKRCGEEGRVGNRVWPRSKLCTRCIEALGRRATEKYTRVYGRSSG